MKISQSISPPASQSVIEKGSRRPAPTSPAITMFKRQTRSTVMTVTFDIVILQLQFSLFFSVVS